MTKDEALKMAIEQMNVYAHIHLCEHQCQDKELLDVIQACKEALEQPTMTYEQGFDHGWEARLAEEQPAQEPIISNEQYQDLLYEYCKLKAATLSHPAPSWQGLSDDELDEIVDRLDVSLILDCSISDFVGAIEAKLKEKNT